MQALSRNRYGPPEVVQVIDVPKPVAGPNDLLVRVHASAVNAGDWRIRAAAFPGVLAVPGRLMFGLTRPRNPRLGSEFAGVVEQAGAGVSGHAPGARVYGIVVNGGASAQYLALPHTAAVAAMPQGLTFEQAAALPFGGLCALWFLDDLAGVTLGQRLLVVGGSGGVGSYAVQIAKSLGAHVTGVAGPDSQAHMTALGADATLDYRATPIADWPGAFDVVFDTVGALTPAAARGLLTDRGVFLPLNYGLREIGAALTNPFRRQKVRIAVNDDTASGLRRVSQLVETGQVRPVIARTFPLDQAAQAHALVESRHRHGSVVLSID